MRFNASKCYILNIKKEYEYLYQLNNTILKQVKSNPYLGLEFSNDLKWNTHMQKKITSRASSTLGFLQRNLKHCPQECRRLAYLALVRPTLEYGAIVWDSHNQTYIDRLERIQNRAAIFIKQDYRTKDPGCVTAMLQDLHLPKLKARQQQLRLTLMYKVVEGLLPAMPPSEFFTPRPQSKRRIKAKSFKD